MAEDGKEEAGEAEEGGKESGSASLLAEAEKEALLQEDSTLEEQNEEDMERARWV